MAYVKGQMRNSKKGILVGVELDLSSRFVTTYLSCEVEIANSSTYLSEWL